MVNIYLAVLNKNLTYSNPSETYRSGDKIGDDCEGVRCEP